MRKIGTIRSLVSFIIFLAALNIKLTKLMKGVIGHGICSIRGQNLKILKILSILEGILPPSPYIITSFYT